MNTERTAQAVLFFGSLVAPKCRGESGHIDFKAICRILHRHPQSTAVRCLFMKLICVPLILCCASAAVVAAPADRIYRCGSEYTNTVPEGNPKGCKLIEGGNVSVVQAHRSPAPSAPGARASGIGGNGGSGATGTRVDAGDQRARDSDARQILDAELRRAETRQIELAGEYNRGEPEKRGDEHRNYQKYLDRVAELKASLARNESDIAGLKRELARLPPGTATAASK